MSLRSNDNRPWVSVSINSNVNLVLVPKRDWKKYKPEEIRIYVGYKIPILGTKGAVILEEEFQRMCKKFETIEEAQDFYKRKMISYNARKESRYARLWEENKQKYI